MILENFLIDCELALKHFEPVEICKLATLSKEINVLCSRIWNKASVEYFKETITKPKNNNGCVSCTEKHLYIKNLSLCCKCFYNQFVTRTECKKIYKLNDEHLTNLFSVEKYIAIYRTYAVYYKKTDIVNLALLHNKGPGFNDKKPSKALQKRLDMLQTLYDKMGIREEEMGSSKYLHCIFDYKKNGAGGIRKVKKALENWDRFENHIILNMDISNLSPEEINAIKLKFVHDEYDEVLTFEELGNISKRRFELKNALEKYNLQIRDDSELCKRYITYNELSISEVVKSVRIMNFLYKETNYKNIINNEIDDIRYDIRMAYGYLPEHVYKDIIRSYIEPLKVRALKNWKRKNRNVEVPDFMHEYDI